MPLPQMTSLAIGCRLHTNSITQSDYIRSLGSTELTRARCWTISSRKSLKKIFFSCGPIEGTVEIHFLSGGVGVSVVPLKAVDYL